MADYDFSTLNSTDLEDLVCDLLNCKEKRAQTKIVFKTYKEGRDKGIDFRYSSEYNENSVIGQVKHYLNSGVPKLLKDLEKVEKSKVALLNPSRYIFATSLGLNPENEKKIFHIFHPYITQYTDIHDRAGLNRLLEEFPKVLDSHFKLWYSSTAVLSKLLNYDIDGRAHQFLERDIKRKLRLYVETPLFKKALEVLDKNNFIVITGEPGIGKTTTAEMILQDFIRRDFEFSYVLDDIKDVERILRNDDSKQIFYYDDFLGQNSAELLRAKGAETALLSILKRINDSQNKKLILTTRTFILNTVVEESERLRRFNIKAKESTIKLSEYSDDLKEKLLSNHIDESDLEAEYKQVLVGFKVQRFILSHANFSPRSVEFITSAANIADLPSTEYEEFIVHNFNSPDEIWRQAYEQQIRDVDRFLLCTMASFPGVVGVKDLEVAFFRRLDYEVKFNNYTKPLDAFRTSFRRLEGGFIVELSGSKGLYEFINPSLTDFLIKYLQRNRDEVSRIAESAMFIKQLTMRLFTLDNKDFVDLRHRISPRLRNILLFENSHFIQDSFKNECRLELALLIHRYIVGEDANKEVGRLFQEIDCWTMLTTNSYETYIFEIFLNEVSSPILIDILRDDLSEKLLPVFCGEYDLRKLIEFIKHMGELFGIQFTSAFFEHKYFDLKEHVTMLINDNIDKDIEDLKGYAHAGDFVDELEAEVSNKLDFFAKIGLTINSNIFEYSNYNWEEIGWHNYWSERSTHD